MHQPFLPAVLSVLIITSLFCPVVNAAPNETEEPQLGAVFAAAPAIPAISEFVYAGVVFLIAGASVVEIGKHLDIRWEDPAESWERFAERVSTELEKVFAKQWVKVTSPDGDGLMTATYEYYTAPGSPKGKDDKWYFEARKNHGKIEINPERMDIAQAVKEMGRGKDIMTLNRRLATDVVNRFKSDGIGRRGDTRFENPHHDTDGYYYHLHYGRNAIERLHCWIWKNV